MSSILSLFSEQLLSINYPCYTCRENCGNYYPSNHLLHIRPSPQNIYLIVPEPSKTEERTKLMTEECETKYCHAVENFLITYNRAFDCFNGELCMEIVEAILDRIKTSNLINPSSKNRIIYLINLIKFEIFASFF